LDIPNASEADWEADNESDMELDNGSEDSDTLEWRNVSTQLNLPGLIRPIQWSKCIAEKTSMTVNIMETRRNNGIKKK